MARAQSRRGRWSWSSSIAGALCVLVAGAVACSSTALPPAPDAAAAQVGGAGGAIAAQGGTGAGGSGAGGMGAGGAVVGSTPQALVPDATGWVDRGATGSTNIQGQWYAYADGIGTDGSTASGTCELAGHPAGDCSQVATPQPGSFPNLAGKMCTSGIAARVVPGPATGTTPDYNSIRGAGIALDFNDPGVAMPGASMPYDALANGVRGIAFDIDAVPSGGLRVQFPTPATAIDPAFWGGDLEMLSPVLPGHNELRWPSVTGPFYVFSPPAFDPTAILSIRFHVESNAASATPYMFCVSNLAALYR